MDGNPRIPAGGGARRRQVLNVRLWLGQETGHNGCRETGHNGSRETGQNGQNGVRCGVVVAMCVAAAMIVAHIDQVAAEELTLSAQPPQLLVLFDGRVLHGRISERPGGYMIESAGSKQVIPFEHIRLAASSLDDAYIKQRDALKKPTAGDHLQLAQWCCEYKLYTHATEQLTAALTLEPNRSEARALLQKIADVSPEQVGVNRHNRRGAGQADAATGNRTAAGIQPQTQSEFVSRVQPILVNGCGNANCHGSAAQNDLKLANVRTGRRQQRVETEGNLAAVLRHVDRQRPEMSALLRVPLDADSRAHRGLFTGQAGTSQLERLRAWVRQVANELQATEPEAPLWVDNAAGGDGPTEFAWDDAQQGVRQAVHEVESPLLIEIPRSPQPATRARVTQAAAESAAESAEPPKVGERRAAAASEERAAFLRNILEQDRNDAFDPDEFNRQVHGGGGRAPDGR